LVVVAGTGTEVGKTWVAHGVATRLIEAGLRVTARKPAQSFGPEDQVTDADILASATGEDPYVVCPAQRWYRVPMAPPMAAEALGLAVPTLEDLLDEVAANWPDPPADLGLLETAGGVASPIASDADNAQLAHAIDADIAVLVADPGLGTINSVRLGASALAPTPTVVFLNRFDPGIRLHQANLDWLEQRDGFTVATTVSALSEHLQS
jgi:dethiobiotin synthase